MLGAGRRQPRDKPIPRLLYPCSLSLQVHAFAILFEFSSPTPELAHVRIPWSVESGLCEGVFLSLQGSRAPRSQKTPLSGWYFSYWVTGMTVQQVAFFSLAQVNHDALALSALCGGSVHPPPHMSTHTAHTYTHTHSYIHEHTFTRVHKYTHGHLYSFFFLFSCHPLSLTKCQNLRKGDQLPDPWL